MRGGRRRVGRMGEGMERGAGKSPQSVGKGKAGRKEARGILFYFFRSLLVKDRNEERP